MVYDITNPESYDEIWNLWVPRVLEEKLKPTCKFFLLGNKSDLGRDPTKKIVDVKMAEEKAIQQKFVTSFIVSSRKNSKMDEMLQKVGATLGEAVSQRERELQIIQQTSASKCIIS